MCTGEGKERAGTSSKPSSVSYTHIRQMLLVPSGANFVLNLAHRRKATAQERLQRHLPGEWRLPKGH